MVLLSGFGDLFADYGYPLFHYAPRILVMHPFFCNVPPKYCDAPVHYEKTGTLQKTGGCIMKKWALNKRKRVPVTSKVPRNLKQEPLLKTVYTQYQV